MRTDRRSTEAAPDDADVRILVPIAALVVAALGLLAGALWFASASQDELARKHERQLIEHAIATVRRQIVLTVKDYAYWDEAVHHLVLGLDPAWADGNVGGYIFDTFGFEYSFVLDGDDRTIYGQIDGARSDADAFAVLGAPLGRLIAQARAAPLAPGQAPEPVSGVLEAGGGVVVAAVSPLLPQAGSDLQLPSGQRSVLVFVKRLGPELVAQIEADFSFQDVRIGKAPATAGLARIPLLSPAGSELAAITWVPHQPGRKLLVWLTPALLVALLVFLGFAGVALRNVRLAAAVIRDGKARFRDIAEASSDWLWETDAELRVRYVSERFATIAGISPADDSGPPSERALASGRGPRALAASSGRPGGAAPVPRAALPPGRGRRPRAHLARRRQADRRCPRAASAAIGGRRPTSPPSSTPRPRPSTWPGTTRSRACPIACCCWSGCSRRWPNAGAGTGPRRSCASISTGSRRSTTASATPPAIC